MTTTLNTIINEISENVPHSETEYFGENGLLHCAVCHKALQTKVNILGNEKTVRCICDCKKKELDAYNEKKKREEIEIQRKICFVETSMANWTFKNDDKKNAKLSQAMKNYVEQFADFKKSGTGLILHGPVGTGKTYMAACVANALIDKEYYVLMTNFATLTNIIQGMYEGKQKYIESLNKYSLLIIDDLGTERKSEFMQEMVYNIIDSRYRSGKPFIVTTNLSIEEMMNTKEIGYQRIYDRVLERCYPIKVAGTSRRSGNFKNNILGAKEKLGL